MSNRFGYSCDCLTNIILQVVDEDASLTSLKVDFHCRLIFTCVNKTIEAMNRRSRVNLKGEPRSSLTFTRNTSYIASILFKRVKCTCTVEINP